MFPSFSKHKVSLAFLDVLVIVAGFGFAFWFVFPSGFYYDPRLYPVYFVPSIVALTIIFLFVFQLEGLYKYQSITNPQHQTQSLLKCYLKILSAFVLLVFFLKTEYIADSRLTIGIGFLVSFLLMALSRGVVIPRIFYAFIRKGIIRKPTIIVGAGEHGEIICRGLQSASGNYFDILGFCDDDPLKKGTWVCDREVLGNSSELEEIISKHNIQEVIIAITNIEKCSLFELVDRCKNSRIVIHIISDLLTVVNEKLQVEEFGGLRTYRIVSSENGIVRDTAKRLMDLLGSAVLLIIFAPVFAVIAWAIKKGSPGSAFYMNDVVGKGGRIFRAYKFRTMIENNPQITQITQNGEEDSLKREDEKVRRLEVEKDGKDERGKNKETENGDEYQEGHDRHIEFMRDFIQGNNGEGEFFVNDESRVTSVGRVLRKYSLDELPQLINVFRGEMSLVGPRFCSVEEYSFYKPWHKRRFAVKPGMTGLWQVRARSEVSYDDMVMLDLYYIENRSIFFDIEILLRTITVVAFGKGSRIA